MTQRAIRAWSVVHKWTSLVSTAFLLMLCITGLPLIFHDELGLLLGETPALPAASAGATAPTLDAIVEKALAAHPGEVMQFLSFEDDRPVAIAATGARADGPPDASHIMWFDLRSGAALPAPDQPKGFLNFMLSLHEDMFLGLPGQLFLGAMGLLLLVAIVSGVVLYAPFMRKLEFGAVRRDRSPRVLWLDLHNLLGVVTVVWLCVVGATGIINTLNPVIAGLWQQGQLAEMTAPYRNAPPIRRLASVDAAAATALKAAPGMKIVTIAFPGSKFSSRHHYDVFLKGASPVSSRLLKPALVDAQTGRLTDVRDMPLYVRILFVSEPLHFGDYGGMPLKIVWAMLDLVSIVVLGSGLYLWLGRRASGAPLAAPAAQEA